MGFVEPLIAIITAIGFLLVLLYKRLNLGIALNVAALFLAFLALDWARIPVVIYETSVDPPTISVVLATFGIMLLSELYKETKTLGRLSGSISRLINNPKIALCILPAIIGLLPVSGGALMSAPLVDAEAEKLAMKPNRKAYINLWFRHTIFPIYPLSPVIITAALLTGVSIPLIIVHQIPVFLVMITVGYVIGFWKTPQSKIKEPTETQRLSDLRIFLVSFSPILTTVIITVALSLSGLNSFVDGFDVTIAILVGLIIMIAISRLTFSTFTRPFKTWGIYVITLAAYGAFLLRNMMVAAGISSVFSSFMTNSSIDIALFLAVVPAILAFVTASASGGVATSVPILLGIVSLPFAPKVAALIYISAFLGYLVAPTHLCFQFTANYFKCSLDKAYKYLIPSFLITFSTAILVYFLL